MTELSELLTKIREEHTDQHGFIYDVLDLVQAEQKVWAEYNFEDKQGGEYAFKGMVEELGELSRALLKYSQGIRGFDKEQLNHAVQDSIADLIVFACNFCSNPPEGVDPFSISRTLNEVWDQVRSRDWKQFPNNGRTE